MPKPFSVSCPNCEARLKIQNPKAIGKKVRCPNCESPFTVKPPRATAPLRDEFDAEDDFDDYDDYDNYDDYDDDFGPPQRSSRRPGPASRSTRGPSRRSASARGKKPKRGKKKSNNKLPLIIGGAVLGLLLLVGLSFMVYALVGGKAVEMAWLPPDSEVVASIEMSEVWNASLVQRMLQKGNSNTEDFNKALNLDQGESIDAIENITIGSTKMPAGGISPFGGGFGRNQVGDFDMIMVIRKKTPWNMESVKGDHEELTHNDKTYYKSKAQSVASFFPDKNTRVMGTEESVKNAITRGPDSGLKDKFSFMPTGHQIVVAFKPKDPENLTREMPRGLRGGMGNDQEQRIQDNMKKIQGGAIAVDIGSGIDFEVTGHFTDSGVAGQLQDDLQQGIAEARKQFDVKRRELNEQTGNMPAAFQEQMREGLEAAESVFNTVSTKQSGENVVITAGIPASVINKFEEKFGDKAAPMMPGFDPGKMFNLLGAVSQASDAAQRAQDKNNLKQIGLAMHNYHDTYRSFPPTKDVQTGLSWRVHLLPFLEQPELYKKFKLDEPWNSPNNIKLVNQMPEVFRRPGSNLPPGKTSYLSTSGPGGIMENGHGCGIREITDGTSNTAMVVEVEDHAGVIWTKPEDFVINANNPRGNLGGWKGGFHVLLCDGSVRFLATSLNAQNLLDILQRNDGHPTRF